MSYDPHGYWASLHANAPGTLSAVGYAAMGNGFNGVAYRRRLAAVKLLLGRVLGNRVPVRILEGAVGVGAYAPLWSELGCQAWTGLDISQAAIAILSGRFPKHRFVAMDMGASEAAVWAPVGPERGFDLVTAIDVLYHLTDDAACQRALANLARYVAPGGALVLSDVFVETVHQRSGHVRRRPYEFYRDALQAEGLVEAGRQPIFSVLGDPVPRSGFHPADAFMWNMWRVLQKSVRLLPPRLRDPLGAAAAWSVYPLDALFCRMGMSAGVNLELAAFRAPA